MSTPDERITFTEDLLEIVCLASPLSVLLLLNSAVWKLRSSWITVSANANTIEVEFRRYVERVRVWSFVGFDDCRCVFVRQNLVRNEFDLIQY
jgi:hypothetical protein